MSVSSSRMQPSAFDGRVRRASPDDAAGIIAVLAAVTAERIYSAIERPWSVAQQRTYLASLSAREACHVATDETGTIVGYQSLDRYSALLTSMAHVAQLGTFLLPAWRGRGLGRALFQQTAAFARSSGYRKIVIQVRASNDAAQAYYQRQGFTPCGRLSRQVIIDGEEDDEIALELFL